MESTSADENGAKIVSSLRLDSFPDIFEQYPFPSVLRVTYLLSEGTLFMQIEVENLGTQTQPFGFGIHPWFPVQLRAGQKLPEDLAHISFEDRGKAEVRVPANGSWVLEKLMPTGEISPALGEYNLCEFSPLAECFFDHVFTQVVHQEDGWSSGGLRDKDSGLEMVLAADGGFREWVLYAPLDRRVIALEPYTCVTDAVNLQEKGVDAGLIALPAGETWRGVITFGLR